MLVVYGVMERYDEGPVLGRGFDARRSSGRAGGTLRSPRFILGSLGYTDFVHFTHFVAMLAALPRGRGEWKIFPSEPGHMK